jgi:intracellular sulfur oxidation DsrE/DsrF family protein
MDRRAIFGILSAALVAAPAAADEAKTKHHRLVIHVDQNDPALMNMALNNAGHVVEYYHKRGEEVAIEIVAYSQGLPARRHLAGEGHDPGIAREGEDPVACRLQQHHAADAGERRQAGSPVPLIAAGPWCRPAWSA